VRRLSLASVDSGAESSVYGAATSAAASMARWRGRPEQARHHQGRGVRSAVKQSAPFGPLLPAQVGTTGSRLPETCDKSVVDQQSGRWYVKDIRASTQPMGSESPGSFLVAHRPRASSLMSTEEKTGVRIKRMLSRFRAD
jgi:hypothetical protein